MSIGKNEAQRCIIWMHGLGADKSDMAGLARGLSISGPAFHHVFLAAPRRPITLNNGMVMPAWYDILGMQLADREDKSGIEQSAAFIQKAIAEQVGQGFREEHIYLAGFSQGGAMALYTALHTSARLGGVIALSAYLPLAQATHALLDKNTPFFLACGHFDSIVLPAWSEQSKTWLIAHGYNNIDCHTYPMEHSVCPQELVDLSAWLNKQQGVK